MTSTDLQVAPKSTSLKGEAGQGCAESLLSSKNKIPVDVLPVGSSYRLLTS